MNQGSSVYTQRSVRVNHDRGESLELGPFRQCQFDPPPPLPPKQRAEILTWPAYEHAENIVHNVKARTCWNPYYKAVYVYIARKGYEIHPAVVKFNMVEAHRLKGLLDRVLREISKLQSRFELIDMFKENETRAMETVNPNDRLAFWKRCDLEIFHLSARVTFNSHYSDYQIHMLNRVSAKKQAEFDFWPGSYVCVYGTEGITKLRDFLASAIAKEEKNPYAPVPVRSHSQ